MRLFSEDIPCLPESVDIINARLVDKATDRSLVFSDVGMEMLLMTNGRRSILQIATEISGKYRTQIEVVLSDALVFFETLNSHFLINIIPSYSDRVQAILASLKAGQIRPMLDMLAIRKRYANAPSHMNRWGRILYLALLFSAKYGMLYFLMFVILAYMLNAADSVVLTINLFLSTLVHELGHLLGMVLVSSKVENVFVGRSAFVVGIYRRPLEPFKEIFVSCLGPILPGIIGILLLWRNASSDNRTYRIAAFIWMAHLVSLVSTDGQNIKAGIQKILNFDKPDKREG